MGRLEPLAPHSMLVLRLLIVCGSLVALASASLAQTTGDADSPRRVAGYKGIWFTLGQYYAPGKDDAEYSARARKPTFPYGDKYSGGLGTYTAKHIPLAIYAPQVDKTFFVFGGTTGQDARHLLCMASYYDHAEKRVPQPVVVHDKNGVDDPHDNPSLAIDAQGYLWVFVSGRARSRPGFKYRSKKPWSIAGFELVSEEEMTYPQPHTLSKSFVHLFTKYTGVRELYWETSLDGVNWSEDRKLAGIRESGHAKGGHYQVSASSGDKVGTFFSRHPNGSVDRRTDLYYVQSIDSGKTWTTVQGTPLSLPLKTVDNPARVADYSTQKLNVYLKDVEFDAQDRPVLLYLTSLGHEPGPPNGPRIWRVTRWTGDSWNTSTIAESDHNYDMGSLYIENDRWVVIAPTQPGPQPHHAGGEIEFWESHDKGRTWDSFALATDRSPLNHNYARRPILARDPFYTFWADGDPTQLTRSQLYFADSSGQNVWQLPYEMTGTFAEPQPLNPRD